MPKLTLRDLFAVAIVALALGWWVDRSRQVKKYESLVQVLKDQDGYVDVGSDGKPTVVWPVFQHLLPEDAAALGLDSHPPR